MKKVLSIVCLLAIAASCLFVFASCGGGTPNSDPDKAVEALEAAGYMIMTDSEMAGTRMIVAVSEDGEDGVSLTYCSDETTAQAAYDALKEQELDGNDIGISGTLVWMGTSAAISAAQ